MKKSDFTKGQTVWLKYVGNRRGEVDIIEITVKASDQNTLQFL